ncbi:MAG TPA: hypothetical protein VKU87_11210 [Thermomicrobiaceae bacterium]|nr:hypothetical protein [Thermomicrobiaceae bacterium]
MMERWEPAGYLADNRPPGVHQSDHVAIDHRDELANLAFSCSGRVVLALLFVGLSIFRLPSSGPTVVALLIVTGGFAACVAGRTGGPLSWARVWIVDLVSLGLLTPWLVFTGFVGAERDPLSTGSDSAYFGCLLASLFFMVTVTAIAAWAARGRPGLAGALVLPGALEVLTLTGVLGDYRDAAVFQAVAVAYAVSALVIFLAIQSPPALRVWVAPAGWLACLVGVFLLTSGFDILGESAGRVVFGQLLLIAASAATVVKTPPVMSWLPAARSNRSARSRDVDEVRSPARRPPRRLTRRAAAGGSDWFYGGVERSSTEELPSLNP